MNKLNITSYNSSLQKGTRFLKVSSKSMIVCNNSFRELLSEIYDVESINFNKIGPLKKFTNEGVIRLKMPLPFSEQLTRVVLYRHKKITISPISELEGLSFEKANLKKVYITGLNPATTPESISRVFSQFGEVAYCKLAERLNVNGAGFGYLLFDKRCSVDKMLEFPREIIVDGYRVAGFEYSASNLREGSKRGREFTQMEPLNGANLHSTDSGRLGSRSGESNFNGYSRQEDKLVYSNGKLIQESSNYIHNYCGEEIWKNMNQVECSGFCYDPLTKTINPVNKYPINEERECNVELGDTQRLSGLNSYFNFAVELKVLSSNPDFRTRGRLLDHRASNIRMNISSQVSKTNPQTTQHRPFSHLRITAPHTINFSHGQTINPSYMI